MTVAKIEKSRPERALEILTGFLGAVFIFAGLFKLAGIEEWTVTFQGWDYSHAFQLAVGMAELVGGAFLMWRRAASLVALGLGGLLLGAIYTHVFRGNPVMALVPIGLMALLAVVAITRWADSPFSHARART